MKLIVELLNRVPFLNKHKRAIALIGLVLVGAIQTLQGQTEVLAFIEPEWLNATHNFLLAWGVFGLIHAKAKRRINLKS